MAHKSHKYQENSVKEQTKIFKKCKLYFGAINNLKIKILCLQTYLSFDFIIRGNITKYIDLHSVYTI